MTFSPKLKRRLYVTTLALGLCLACKLAWFEAFAPASDGHDVDDSRDLAMRSAYLAHRVASEQFGVADMPMMVASPYRQELAIATLSMTSVALTNLSFRDPAQVAPNREAVKVMLSRMLSDEIRHYDVLWWGEDAIDSLAGDKGHAGYLGHLNLTLGCYFLLGGDDPVLRDLHERVSEALARRLERSGSYHAESFPGWIYTADNVVVILSLRLHDSTAQPRYAALIARWLDFSQANLLDPASGMLRYYVSAKGHAAGTSRGVLQAWNSMWLPLIDEQFARDQYEHMDRALVARSAWANLAAIREYPAGQTGPTDLVSGPLLFGLSPTATGFGMGGASFWGDATRLAGLLRTAELAGFTWSFGGRRSYLFAPLLGDAIILAARTMTKWDGRFVRRRDGDRVAPEDKMVMDDETGHNSGTTIRTSALRGSRHE